LSLTRYKDKKDRRYFRKYLNWYPQSKNMDQLNHLPFHDSINSSTSREGEFAALSGGFPPDSGLARGLTDTAVTSSCASLGFKNIRRSRKNIYYNCARAVIIKPIESIPNQRRPSGSLSCTIISSAHLFNSNSIGDGATTIMNKTKTNRIPGCRIDDRDCPARLRPHAGLANLSVSKLLPGR